MRFVCRPRLNASRPSCVKPELLTKRPRAHAALPATLPENAMRSAKPICGPCHLASTRYVSVWSRKLPSICSPTMRKEPRGARSNAANTSVRNPSKRNPRSCGPNPLTSISRATSACADASDKITLEDAGAAFAGSPKLFRKAGSSRSGILNETPGRAAFKRSISSRVRGLPLPRRHVIDWWTIAIINAVKRSRRRSRVNFRSSTMAGRLLPPIQNSPTPAWVAAMGKAVLLLPLPGKNS